MTERLPFHFSLSCIGEGNGNPLQCSCLENPRDWGAWWASIYVVAQCRTRLKRLSSKQKKNKFTWSTTFKILHISNGLLSTNIPIYLSEVKLLSRFWLFATPWDSPGKNTGVGCHFFQGSSRPRDWTQVSRIAGRPFNLWATTADPPIYI